MLLAMEVTSSLESNSRIKSPDFVGTALMSVAESCFEVRSSLTLFSMLARKLSLLEAASSGLMMMVEVGGFVRFTTFAYNSAGGLLRSM